MDHRRFRLRTWLLVLTVIGLLGSDTVKGEPSPSRENVALSFRVLPIGASSSKANVPIYVGIRNTGDKLIRLLPADVPLVWGYSVDDSVRCTKVRSTAAGKETQLPDLTGVVFSDSGPPPRQEYCPGSGPPLLALEKGNEMLVETTVDMAFLGDGKQEIVLNLVVLAVTGESACGAVVAERGTARLRMRVHGEKITFM
jgi:hypothetical protein